MLLITEEIINSSIVRKIQKLTAQEKKNLKNV